MSLSYLSPDCSGSIRFSARSYYVVLCSVHICTSLAWIEFSLISRTYTLSFWGELCAPSDSVDPVYGQHKWPWTTTACQTYWLC